MRLELNLRRQVWDQRMGQNSRGATPVVRRFYEQHVQAGTARFLRANAADFTIPETVSLVVSTYDALNHFPGSDMIRTCFTVLEAADQER